MAVTNAANGTTTPTVGGGASTLATVTTPGVYVLTVDLANMVSGDTVTIAATLKALTGGTARTAFTQTFTGAQTVPSRQSQAILAEHELVLTLNQTAGTARAFPWSLARADG